MSYTVVVIFQDSEITIRQARHYRLNKMAGSHLYQVFRCRFCLQVCPRTVYGNTKVTLHQQSPLRCFFYKQQPRTLSMVFRAANTKVIQTATGFLGRIANSSTQAFISCLPTRLVFRSLRVLKLKKRILSFPFLSILFRNRIFQSSVQRVSFLLVGCGILGSCFALSTSLTSHCQTPQTPITDPQTVAEDNFKPLVLQKDLSLLQQFTLILRFSYLCLIFSPVLFLHTLAYITGSSYLENLELKYILFVMQGIGPAFIKLGQWASTRRDMFSEEFCKILSFLHTHCDPHPWSETARMLEENFGEDWEESLLILDRNPIGSGCVAQVYRGHIRSASVDTDSPGLILENPPSLNSSKLQGYVPIAVKVLHPGIIEAMDIDIRLMMYMASWVDRVYPDVHWIALQECVAEFANSMQKQLNLETEAKNLSKFNVLMNGYDNVKFPTPFYPYVTKTVLVETFEHGDHISEYLDTPGENLQKTLAKIGVEVLLDMMFVHNFVHGDLHPGNILVQDPFTDDPKLVLVDCGIATSLGPADFENFYKVFKAIVKGDGATVADLFLGAQPCQTLTKYRQDMAELVDESIQHLNLRDTQVGTLFSRLFDVLIEHKVRIEPNYTSVMVAFMVIEGVARSLDPTLDIFVYAKPCILQRAKFAIKEQLKQTVRQKLPFCGTVVED